MKNLFTLLAIVFAAYTINAQSCQAYFTYTTNPTGLATFVDQSTTQTGSVISWFWDFGDGTSSTLANATHQYNANGAWVACLIITTSDSCVSTYCDSVVTGNGQNPCAGFSMTSQVYHESTPGAYDGSVTVNVVGGTPPYNYNWTITATTPTITNLTSGTYCITVTDFAGCSLTECYTVLDDSSNIFPCQMYVTGIITDESTAGANDGAIDITVNGGMAPYYYYWMNGQSTEDLSGLSSGTYTVVVEDSDSCMTTTTFFVDVVGGSSGPWDSLYTNIVDTCLNFIYDTVYVYNYTMIDSFTVAVTWAFQGSGQIGFVTVEYAIYQPGYNWFILSVSCGTKSIETFIDLVFVDYSITATETINGMNSFNLYPNPVNDRFNIDIDLKESANVDISIVNSLGQNVYQSNTSINKGKNTISINSGNLEHGVYFIIISSENERLQNQRFVK